MPVTGGLALARSPGRRYLRTGYELDPASPPRSSPSSRTMMRTLRSPSRLVVLCIALLLAAGATSVMASKGAPDRKPPKVSLTSPADGSATFDATPRLAGRAGHAEGDRRAMSVRVYLGAKATGRPQRVLSRRAARALLGREPRPALLPGTYTAKASQLDGARQPRRQQGLDVHDQAGATVAKPPVKVTPPPPSPCKPGHAPRSSRRVVPEPPWRSRPRLPAPRPPTPHPPSPPA